MLKKKKNYKPEEVGILLEDIDDKVSVIAESHLVLNKKTDVSNKKVDKILEDLEIVKVRVDGIAEDLGSVKEDIEVIKMDIEFIKHELKNKVDRNEFAALERRVSLLENRR